MPKKKEIKEVRPTILKPEEGGPKILTFDLETWPYVVKAWRTGDQYIRHDRIVHDRAVASFAAKWAHDHYVMFFSTKNKKDLRDDRGIARELHKLLNAADVVITQNGKRFDEPLIKGRFLTHGLGPVGEFKHYDTCQMAKKMGLPSTKLDYLTKRFAPQFRKLSHKLFPGDELWDECEARNPKAWKEMEAYNKRDVRGTEAVFFALAPYLGINFSVYHDGLERVCACGSKEWYDNGFAYNNAGKFKRWKCKKCGANFTEKGQANNLLGPVKRASLKGGK